MSKLKDIIGDIDKTVGIDAFDSVIATESTVILTGSNLVSKMPLCPWIFHEPNADSQIAEFSISIPEMLVRFISVQSIVS